MIFKEDLKEMKDNDWSIVVINFTSHISIIQKTVKLVQKYYDL